MRSYMLTIRGVLQGLERFGWDASSSLADRAILLAFGVAALAAGAGLRGLAIAFVGRAPPALRARGVADARCSSAASACGSTRAIWRELQPQALPLGFFLVVLNLYSYVDSVMLGVMRGDAETGIYAAAYKTYEGFSYSPVDHRRSADAAALAICSSRTAATHRRLALLGSRDRRRGARGRSAVGVHARDAV